MERAKSQRHVEAGRKGGKAHAGRVGATNGSHAIPGSIGHERRHKRQFRDLVVQVIADVVAGRPPDPNEPKERAKIRDLAVEALRRAAGAEFTQGQLARALCEIELVGCVAFWAAVRDGHYGAEVSERLRASENLANRGGLPAVTAQAVGAVVPQKLFEIPGIELGVPVHDQPPEPETRQ